MREARRKLDRSIRSAAIRLLARREYARAELALRLTGRGATAEEVTRVLDELEREGYLSDARYAQTIVARKSGRYGKRAIAHALRERGVGLPEVRVALDALAGIDEFAAATAAWERRFGAQPKDEREHARHVRFLMARGYSLSTALKVVRRPAVHRDREESSLRGRSRVRR